MEDNKKDQGVNAAENADTMENKTSAPLSLDTADDEVAVVISDDQPVSAPADTSGHTSGLSLDADADMPAAVVNEMTPTEDPSEAATNEIPSIDTMDTLVAAKTPEQTDDVSLAQAAIDGMVDPVLSEHDIPVIEANKTVNEAAADKAKEQEDADKVAVTEQQEFETAMQDDLPETEANNKKKMMMAAIVVLAIGGAGAFWMMSQETTPSVQSAKVMAAETQEITTEAEFTDMPPMPDLQGDMTALDVLPTDDVMADMDMMAAEPDMLAAPAEDAVDMSIDMDADMADMADMSLIDETDEVVPDLPLEALNTETSVTDALDVMPINDDTELDLAAAMAPQSIEKISEDAVELPLIEEPTAAELALVAEAGAPVSVPTETSETTETMPVANDAVPVETDLAAEMAPKPTERVVVESFTETDAQKYIEGLGDVAKIRPLPKSYLILRKTAERDSVNTNLVAAQRALNEGRLRAAVDMFETLYMKHGDNQRVLMGRALSYHKMKNNRKALAAYEDVLALEPKNLEALTNMLGILRIQEPKLALERLLDLYELYPSNDAVLAQLGGTYAHMKQYSKAIKYLDIAVAMEPDNMLYHYNRAITLDHMGRRHEAINAYQLSLTIMDQNDIEPHNADIPVSVIRARIRSLR